MQDSDFVPGNILLQQLPAEAIAMLRPHLSRVPMSREQHLTTTGEHNEVAYFLEGGVASCVAAEGGARTQVGLIGREGMVGLGALLGDDVSPLETYIQVDGSTALAISRVELQHAMDSSAPLRAVMLRYVSYFLMQVAYGLASSAQHLMEARLARWLLMCHDRVDGDEIAITHEFMGVMISAQRSGVTVTLHTLEGLGMIRSTRGLVTIRDRAKLADMAGESYGLPEERYRALIGPFGKSIEPKPEGESG